jgi:hypothetical protein
MPQTTAFDQLHAIAAVPGNGDFAAGMRTLPRTDTLGDFAAGMRTLARTATLSDFAAGMRTLPRVATVGNFATGMRTDSAPVVINMPSSAVSELAMPLDAMVA